MGRFEELLQIIAESIHDQRSQSYGALADRYELAGALDLLRDFSINGHTATLREGCDRLARIFERFPPDVRNLADDRITELRAIGVQMTRHDREELHELEGITVSVPVRPTPSSEQQCDILVVSALYEPELTEFLAHLTDVTERSDASLMVGGASVYFGQLKDTQSPAHKSLSVAAVAQDRQGMVEAAALTVLAAHAFRPSFAAMTGVCAGRSAAGVRICDVIVPREIFTYDTGKHSEDQFEVEPFSVFPSETVLRRVRARGSDLLMSFRQDVMARHVADIDSPRLHAEVAACGSAVVNKVGMVEQIAARHRKLVGLDMESYGFLRAVRLYADSLPAFVVKGVMDAGQDKRDTAKRRAAFWAAGFLARFLTSEFEHLVR